MANPSIQAPGGFVPRMALSFGADAAPAVAVTAAVPLPIAMNGSGTAYLDRSGAIATGGSAQTVADANPGRRGFHLQNLSAGDLWLSSLGIAAAAAPGFRIAPGQLYESPAHGVPTGALSVFGAAAGQAFSAGEW